MYQQGRVLPCKAGFGGIKAAYFFDLDGLGTLTYTDGVNYYNSRYSYCL